MFCLCSLHSMKKDKAPLKDLIKGIIGKLEKEGKGPEHGIVPTWEKVVGKKIAKHTKPVTFKAGRFVVNVSDSSRLYELTLKRQTLICELNKELKKKKVLRGRTKTIKEIRFKIGEV